MKNQKGQDDTLERILGQGTRKDQQDDTLRMSVRFNDVEQIIVERRRRIEWVEDPQNPGVTVPYTVSDVVYSIDQNGNPLGTTKSAGGCRFGHIARTNTLTTCALCRRTVCRRHSITVGDRAYCRRGVCFLVGAFVWSFALVFRSIAFCVMSILGVRGNDVADRQEAQPPVPDNPARGDIRQVYPDRRE